MLHRDSSQWLLPYSNCMLLLWLIALWVICNTQPGPGTGAGGQEDEQKNKFPPWMGIEEGRFDGEVTERVAESGAVTEKGGGISQSVSTTSSEASRQEGPPTAPQITQQPARTNVLPFVLFFLCVCLIWTSGVRWHRDLVSDLPQHAQASSPAARVSHARARACYYERWHHHQRILLGTDEALGLTGVTSSSVKRQQHHGSFPHNCGAGPLRFVSTAFFFSRHGEAHIPGGTLRKKRSWFQHGRSKLPSTIAATLARARASLGLSLDPDGVRPSLFAGLGFSRPGSRVVPVHDDADGDAHHRGAPRHVSVLPGSARSSGVSTSHMSRMSSF